MSEDLFEGKNLDNILSEMESDWEIKKNIEPYCHYKDMFEWINYCSGRIPKKHTDPIVITYPKETK